MSAPIFLIVLEVYEDAGRSQVTRTVIDPKDPVFTSEHTAQEYIDKEKMYKGCYTIKETYLS